MTVTKMVLKWAFVDDTREEFALQVHCSDLLWDRASSQYNSFTWKMVFKRPFINDIEENLICMFIV